MLTFCQFSFVTLVALPGQLELRWWGRCVPYAALKPRKLPLSIYGIMALFFFALSVVNNQALAYNVRSTLPLPVSRVLLSFF